MKTKTSIQAGFSWGMTGIDRALNFTFQAVSA
jgi:hypothetical protein